MINYEPIPIYDDIVWDLTSEACHMLIVAPSGGGKTVFLNYLGAWVLKQQHELYVIDAKKSNFGAMFSSICKTASDVENIIQMLNELKDSMDEDYEKYFSSEMLGMGENYKTLGLPAHVLIFDEVLAALETGDKKQKTRMEVPLKQLAIKGRMAGYIIVLSAQKLLATDLPKAITEQCQTRIILGSLVSDETFHTATGYYKKDLATAYRGAMGKGYAVTPKNGLSYIETPWMDIDPFDFRNLIMTFHREGSQDGKSD